LQSVGCPHAHPELVEGSFSDGWTNQNSLHKSYAWQASKENIEIKKL